MEFSISSGGIELIDRIEPVWEELNKSHSEKSPFFSNDFKHFKFIHRKKELEIKAISGLVRVTLCEDKENNVLGFTVASIEDNIGEIDSICVKSNLRKKGIGTSLMNNQMNWFKQMNVKKIKVVVVYGNEDAFSFYQQFGLFPRAVILTSSPWHSN